MHQVPNTSAAQTDVSEFITDLDGGRFDSMLSIALGESAAAAVDHNKVAEVNIKLHLKRIPGTHQVTVKSTLKYARPTAAGKRSEEAACDTVMHVGKNGVMSLIPQNQTVIPGMPVKA